MNGHFKFNVVTIKLFMWHIKSLILFMNFRDHFVNLELNRAKFEVCFKFIIFIYNK